MPWAVSFSEEFEPEFDALPQQVQDAILARATSRVRGADARPTACRHSNRVEAYEHEGIASQRGVWRIAFAFDPDQQAILLVGGDKSGVNEKRFYRQLIARPDERFDRHLAEGKG